MGMVVFLPVMFSSFSVALGSSSDVSSVCFVDLIASINVVSLVSKLMIDAIKIEYLTTNRIFSFVRRITKL